MRLWRNWQTRYFEGVVRAISYGFKSHQPHHLSHAVVAELADALVSGTSGGDIVEVQVLSTAPFLLKLHNAVVAELADALL